MVKVVAKNLSKVFKKGKVVALDNINLTIGNGERFGILGPSGAGKTTLMRSIAGLDGPSSGELYFDDKLVAGNGKLYVPPEDRRIGMVFQTWALYPNLTAFENIAFPLTNMKISKEEIKKKVEEVAKILDISHVLHHYPRELSGGQQQRVSLARALVKQPSLLLLDEPFSNLDARMRDSARALVRDVQNELGITLIIVSHDPADIFAIADRVGVLVKGRFAQIGNPDEIYNNPVSVEVASLIGEINEMEGKTSNEGVIVSSFKFPPDTFRSGNPTSEKVVIGIRPENVRLSKEVINDESWVLVGKGKVKVVGYQGGLFRITVSPFESEEEIITYTDHRMNADEEILVYVKRQSVMVFNK